MTRACLLLGAVLLAGCDHAGLHEVRAVNACGGVAVTAPMLTIQSDLDEPLLLASRTASIPGFPFESASADEQGRIARSIAASPALVYGIQHELAPRSSARVGPEVRSDRGPTSTVAVQIEVPAEHVTRAFLVLAGAQVRIARDEHGALVVRANALAVPDATELLPPCALASIYEEPEKLLTARSTWKLGALREREEEPGAYDVDAWTPARSTHFTIRLPKDAWPFAPLASVRVRERGARSVVLVGDDVEASIGEIIRSPHDEIVPEGAFCTDPWLGIARPASLVVEDTRGVGRRTVRAGESFERTSADGSRRENVGVSAVFKTYVNVPGGEPRLAFGVVLGIVTRPTDTPNKRKPARAP